MTTTLRTLPRVAKLVLVVGLLCGIIFAQVGNAQKADLACTVASPSPVQTVAAPATNCLDCCAAMPCCLLSKSAADAPTRPEPLSNERNSQLDHAPMAVVFTPVPTFDFLTPQQWSRSLAKSKVVQRTWESAPRGAVSCIWLI